MTSPTVEAAKGREARRDRGREIAEEYFGACGRFCFKAHSGHDPGVGRGVRTEPRPCDSPSPRRARRPPSAALPAGPERPVPASSRRSLGCPPCSRRSEKRLKSPAPRGFSTGFSTASGSSIGSTRTTWTTSRRSSVSCTASPRRTPATTATLRNFRRLSGRDGDVELGALAEALEQLGIDSKRYSPKQAPASVQRRHGYSRVGGWGRAVGLRLGRSGNGQDAINTIPGRVLDPVQAATGRSSSPTSRAPRPATRGRR